MTDYKTLSLRMPTEMARLVEMIAKMQRRTMTAVIHEAIEVYVDIAKTHKDFRGPLQAQIEADLALLRSLEL